MSLCISLDLGPSLATIYSRHQFRRGRREGKNVSYSSLVTPSTLHCKHTVLGGTLQANHTTDLVFGVVVQVLIAYFLPVSPTGDAAGTVTYSGCSRAASSPSGQD